MSTGLDMYYCFVSKFNSELFTDYSLFICKLGF